MKKLLILSFILFSHSLLAQSTFTDCTAAFLNSKMIVEKYDNLSKCKVSLNAKGSLAVSTVELSADKAKAINNIPFSIAIKDQKTGTIKLSFKEVFPNIDIQNVLTKCKKGDTIVLLTSSDQYALPHNEITVE